MAIKMSCKIKVKNNFSKLKALEKKLPEMVSESIEDVLKNIQTMAIRLEKGHNENGILVELIDTSNMKVKGRVYADPAKFMSNGQSYLFFEYFGTGSYAEMEHVGSTEHFLKSGYTEWFIPVSKVGRSLNYPIITISDNQFYVAHGVKRKSFYE